jgi:hypothetical protein
MEVDGAAPAGEAASSSADARAAAGQIMQLGDQAKGCLDRCRLTVFTRIPLKNMLCFLSVSFPLHGLPPSRSVATLPRSCLTAPLRRATRGPGHGPGVVRGIAW